MAYKILAVDDEKHIVRLVEINLKKAGYEVTTANNGREALEAVALAAPDLIVMDVMMPEMDGFAALKSLKENSATSNIPVIMLTAKAQDADVFKGWQSGADLYLTKPFNPAELLTFVERILSSKDEEEDTYDISDDVFDMDDLDETLLKG
jgi:DNA-binding response OmpR family regulator